jgi:membrane protein DedA with SNARE-associated domain
VTHILQLVDQYGYLILFAALLLELIALPIPTELLMSYVGYLVYKGQMNLILSILVGAAGTSLGMTISYGIGSKLGYPFFKKYGHRVHLGEDRLEKTSKLFSKYGVTLLVISCFIPGVRHLTGYFSGITHSPYKRFAPFAYTGALIWVATFILLGDVLGPKYTLIEATIKRYLVIGGISIGFILLVYLLIRYNHKRIKEGFYFWLQTFASGFNSERRLLILIATVATAFIGLLVLLVGLFQDLLSHDFDEFNRVTELLIKAFFNPNWAPLMRAVLSLDSLNVVMGFVILTLVWMGIRKAWRLEIPIYIGMMAGGWLLSYLIHFLLVQIALHFHLPFQAASSFPDRSLFYLILVYGYFAYELTRTNRYHWFKPLAVIGVLLVVGVIGLSRLYFETMLPSEVVVSLVFGAVWLCFCLLLLECRRLIKALYKK